MPSYKTVSFTLRTLRHIVYATENGVFAIPLPNIQNGLLNSSLPLDGIKVCEQVVALTTFIAHILKCDAEPSDFGTAICGFVVYPQRRLHEEGGEGGGHIQLCHTLGGRKLVMSIADKDTDLTGDNFPPHKLGSSIECHLMHDCPGFLKGVIPRQNA